MPKNWIFRLRIEHPYLGIIIIYFDEKEKIEKNYVLKEFRKKSFSQMVSLCIENNWRYSTSISRIQSF